MPSFPRESPDAPGRERMYGEGYDGQPDDDQVEAERVRAARGTRDVPLIWHKGDAAVTSSSAPVVVVSSSIWAETGERPREWVIVQHSGGGPRELFWAEELSSAVELGE